MRELVTLITLPVDSQKSELEKPLGRNATALQAEVKRPARGDIAAGEPERTRILNFFKCPREPLSVSASDLPNAA